MIPSLIVSQFITWGSTIQSPFEKGYFVTQFLYRLNQGSNKLSKAKAVDSIRTDFHKSVYVLAGKFVNFLGDEPEVFPTVIENTPVSPLARFQLEYEVKSEHYRYTTMRFMRRSEVVTVITATLLIAATL